jgi:hypothetical protein
MSKSKIFLALSLACLTFTNFVNKVDACPKRFKVIKFIGRTVKNGVVGAGHAVASGARTLKGKIDTELSDNTQSQGSSERYTSYKSN